jgi:hypothetical protein
MKLGKAAELMRRDSRLLQMRDKRGVLAWFVVPGGKLEAEVAEELIKRSDVVPQRDGLFPGISQTWRMGS